MSAMTDVHRRAMQFAALGLTERMRGNEDGAASLFKQALENELAAIQELEKLGEAIEPTYSVLHRSAATLALDCNEFRLAEKLASTALAGEPHPKIADELRDVLVKVYSHMRPQVLKSTPAADD